jgi:inner membrane protein
MYISHLPAGYILTKIVSKKFAKVKYTVSAGLLGSIAPDFDMIYKILFDINGVNHRYYFSHFPLFWLFIYFLGIIVTLLLYSLNKINKQYKTNFIYLFSIFIANALLHLLLDLPTGVLLLEPFSNTVFKFVTIPNQYNNYLLNIILHPLFLVEILIVVFAVYLFIKEKKTSASKALQ